AALLGRAGAGVVDEHEAHGAGGEGGEVGPVRRRHARAVYQLEVGLVDERGGVQRLTRSVRAEAALGEGAEGLVDVRVEPLGGAGIAVAGLAEEERGVGERGHDGAGRWKVGRAPRFLNMHTGLSEAGDVYEALHADSKNGMRGFAPGFRLKERTRLRTRRAALPCCPDGPGAAPSLQRLR